MGKYSTLLLHIPTLGHYTYYIIQNLKSKIKVKNFLRRPGTNKVTTFTQ